MHAPDVPPDHRQESRTLRTTRKVKPVSLLIAATLLVGSGTAAHAEKWAELDPSALSDTASVVEPHADAEVLLWSIETQDVDFGTEFVTTQEHHVRIKIYTARGASEHGTVSLPMLESAKLSNVSARTLSPDGVVREVTPREIHDQVVVRTHGLRVRSRSFAFPGAVPGSILDYSYRLTVEGQSGSYYQLLPIQLDIPVRKVELEFVPIVGQEYAIRPSVALGHVSALTTNRPGHYVATITDIPAYHPEVSAPSDFATRLWILGYYTIARGDMKLYWDYWGRAYRSVLQHYSEPPRFFLETTRDVVAGATSDREKIQRLNAFLERSVRNVATLPDSAAALRAGFKPNDRPWDALKKRLGTAYDIEMLMYLMARQLDLSPLLVYTTGRWNPFFDRDHESAFMLTSFRIAFRQPEGLLFASPAWPELPLGWLPDDEEGQLLFLPTSPDEMFEVARSMPPDSSRQERRADVELASDGSAEVRVKLSATGHEALDWSRDFDGRSPAERLERIQSDLRLRLPEAVVHDVDLGPPPEWPASFALSFAVSLPHYATAAGRRLLVPPFFFQNGRLAQFTADTRRSALAIDHACIERDSVRIHLPENLRFEVGAAVPATPLPWGRCETAIQTDEGGRTLVAVRTLRVGEDRLRVFPTFVYPATKLAFEAIARADQQVVIARAVSASAETQRH